MADIKIFKTEEGKLVGEIVDADGSVLIHQEFNPETGDLFSSEDEVKQYLQTHYSDMLYGTSDLDEFKKSKLDEVNKLRDDVLQNQFVYVASNGQKYPLDFDLESQLNIAGLVIEATKNKDFTTAFITKDNNTIMLSNEDILSLGTQAAAWKSDVIMRAHMLKESIRSAKTFEEVENIELKL